MSIGLRIEKIKNELKLNNTSLGASIGTDNSTVGKIIKGTNNLTNSMLVELHSKFNININWILTGNGEMFIVKETSRQERDVDENITVVFNSQDLQTIKESLDKLNSILNRPHQTDKAPFQKIPLDNKAHRKKPDKRKGTS